MVDINMSLTYSSYNYNNMVITQPDQESIQKLNDAEATPIPEKQPPIEETLGVIFANMLNREISGDPEWAEIAAKLADQGHQTIQMELENFGVDFNELQANPAPDIFFPASMSRAQQDMVKAVCELAANAMGAPAPRHSVLDDVSSAPWREAVVQYALSCNSTHINTNINIKDENDRPISQDIQTTIQSSSARMMGTFNVRDMMTTSNRPAAAERPRITHNPTPPPAVTYANYRSADLHSQFAAQHAAAAPQPAPAEKEAQTGDLNVNMARAVSSKFALFLADCATNGVPTNVQALLQWVLRESYLEGLEQLVYNRDKVAMANKGKKALRDAAAAARTEQSRLITEATAKAKDVVMNAFKDKRNAAKATFQAEAETKYTTKTCPYFSEDMIKHLRENYVNDKLEDWDSKTPIPGSTEIGAEVENQKTLLLANNPYPKAALDLTKNPPAMVATNEHCTNIDQMDAYIEDLENKLSSLEDDAQLMNINLQSVLEKQQELISTLSNIGKLLHDTAMAIIRKIS